MANFFNSYFWSLLPPWFKKQDSYKDLNNQGLLERYLKSFGEELDQEYMDFVKFILNILDPSKCPDKLLTHLSSNLGYMPNLTNDNSSTGLGLYKLLLAWATWIYKRKGSLLSFQKTFWILGYEIELIEQVPTQPAFYDSGFLYDDDNFYDGECQWCSEFYLKVTPIIPVEGGFTITPEIAGLIERTANFLKPINATYGGAETGVITNIYYGWVDSLEDVSSFGEIIALQKLLGTSSGSPIEVDFTNNEEYKYLVLFEPITHTPKTSWYGSEVNQGTIGNPGDLFSQITGLAVPDFRGYASAYKTKQTQTTIIFNI